MPAPTASCPCRSGRPYADCCAPCHRGEIVPASAEQLMRSRYTAFVLGRVDYLVATLHPRQRQPDDGQVLMQTMEQTRWLGLIVLQEQQGDEEAFVEFIAFYDDNGLAQLHERSRFRRENGRWYYVDGEFLPPVRLGRNEPCFCGSGKKFKRCHGP